MLITFTIRTRKNGNSDYTLIFSTEVVPTVGTTICFPCSIEGAESGYYFKVEEVIYYPLKSGSAYVMQNGNVDVQVVLENRYQDLKPLVSSKNTMNPGKWEERKKSREVA